MAGRSNTQAARQAMQQEDTQNKYAQVIKQAHATKRQRTDLEDDSWWRRPPTPPPAPGIE